MMGMSVWTSQAEDTKLEKKSCVMVVKKGKASVNGGRDTSSRLLWLQQKFVMGHWTRFQRPLCQGFIFSTPSRLHCFRTELSPSKTEQEVQKLLLCLLLLHTHTHTAFSTMGSYQSSPFVTTDEPTLTHHYHSKSVADIRAHLWCSTFYGFCQTHNGICLPAQHHTALTTLCASPIQPCLPNPWQVLILLLYPVLPFFRMPCG